MSIKVLPQWRFPWSGHPGRCTSDHLDSFSPPMEGAFELRMCDMSFVELESWRPDEPLVLRGLPRETWSDRPGLRDHSLPLFGWKKGKHRMFSSLSRFRANCDPPMIHFCIDGNLSWHTFPFARSDHFEHFIFSNRPYLRRITNG